MPLAEKGARGKGRQPLSPPSARRSPEREQRSDQDFNQVSVLGGRPFNVIDDYDIRSNLSRLQPEAKLLL
jgi:hypothetical protein